MCNATEGGPRIWNAAQSWEEHLPLNRKALEIDGRLVEKTGGANARFIRSLFADRHNLAIALNEMKWALPGVRSVNFAPRAP